VRHHLGAELCAPGGVLLQWIEVFALERLHGRRSLDAVRLA
jgi:hypothetical protein